MTTLSRRSAIAVASAVLATPWIRRAQAAEFNYKFGSDLPASHPMNLRMQEAADQIRTETNGRVEITLFPNNELGSDPDMFGQLRAGALEFFTNSGANALSSLVPKAAISAAGFAFKDDAAAFSALDGQLGAYIRNLITKAGLVVLDRAWDNGFREITTSVKPIMRPSDLSGMKIRVPPGRAYVSLFEALGAAPTPISFNEVYSALQTKVVDGQENPLAVVDLAKLYEVQTYCSLTNHIWDGFWFLCNRAAWHRLPASARDIVAKHVNAAAIEERQDVVKLNASLQAALAAKGLKFNAVDPEPFRAKLSRAGFYAAQKRYFGEAEWALLESVTGPLS